MVLERVVMGGELSIFCFFSTLVLLDWSGSSVSGRGVEFCREVRG